MIQVQKENYVPNGRTKDDGSDDIRAGPHLHDCLLCKQSVESAVDQNTNTKQIQNTNIKHKYKTQI